MVPETGASSVLREMEEAHDRVFDGGAGGLRASRIVTGIKRPW
jgi:hypothetical protein